MLVALPALNDNYIWLYGRDNLPVIVIDPAEAAPVIAYLRQHHLNLEAILLTHMHDDHTNGVAQLHQQYPHIPIFGPTETAAKGATQIIDQGHFATSHYQIDVLPTGGHTANHVSFVIEGHLFCGDCLFCAGCGRVFTQNYQQMFESLQRLNQLPAETIVCPGHEYTLANLAFAAHIATNAEQKETLAQYQKQVRQLRAEQKPSLPTTLELERRINPFLQSQNLAQFIQLRQQKDQF